MDLLLALLLRLEGGLVLGESAAEGTGEAGSEVKRSVLLVLVEQTELGALVGVDDGENASDRLANVVDSLSLRRGTGSDLLDTELGDSIFNSENDDNDQLTVDNNGVPPYRHYRHG